MSVTRVAFLSSEYPPHTYGGLGTVVEALSRFLGARGIEVVMLVPETGDYAPPPPGVTLCPVPVGLPVSDEDYWLTYCESAAATARRTGLHAGVVHCHDWMTALGGLAIGRALGVPVLMSIHLPQAASYHLDLETIGITGCARVIVNSQAVRAELTEREVSQDKISVIPNGVDLDRFRPGDQSADPLQILFAGRLIPQKGPDVLLRAFGAVLRRHPDATLTIAGDGTQRLYLERLARFLGLRHGQRAAGGGVTGRRPGRDRGGRGIGVRRRARRPPRPGYPAGGAAVGSGAGPGHGAGRAPPGRALRLAHHRRPDGRPVRLTGLAARPGASG
jgi:glycosyltransferase involved in cell wall biosynthesis